MMDFNWRPGIGDPTIGGWITVILYFVAVVACWMASRSPLVKTRERQVWKFIVLLFTALGINKQLDLQSALTEIGRALAHIYGWYDRRQFVQVDFIAGLGIAAGVVTLATLIWARTSSFPCWVAILGMAVVLGFVLIRAASFHHVDIFINQTALGLRWNWIIEMGGISTVIAAAAWRRAARASRVNPDFTGRAA